MNGQKDKKVIEELKSKMAVLEQNIEILEQQNKKLSEKLNKYYNENDELFSPMKMQFEEKISTLQQSLKVKTNLYEKLQIRDTAKARKIKELEDKIEELGNNSHVQKLKNERGAGRKERFIKEEIEEIKALREKGFSIAKLAEKYKCSVGLIHKIVNKMNSVN